MRSRLALACSWRFGLLVLLSAFACGGDPVTNSPPIPSSVSPDLTESPSPDLVAAPDVLGLAYVNAHLESLDLGVDIMIEDHRRDCDAPEDTVVAQRPVPGYLMLPGVDVLYVDVCVPSGPTGTARPPRACLRDAGFEVVTGPTPTLIGATAIGIRLDGPGSILPGHLSIAIFRFRTGGEAFDARLHLKQFGLIVTGAGNNVVVAYDRRPGADLKAKVEACV